MGLRCRRSFSGARIKEQHWATFGTASFFDAKWIYVCDANKVSDFSTVNGPGDNIIDLDTHRAEA